MYKLIKKLVFLILISSSNQVFALNCEVLGPNAQVSNPVAVDLKLAAAAIFKLGEIDAEALVETNKRIDSVVSSHQDANPTILKTKLIYLFCEMINEDKEMSTKERLDRYFEVATFVLGADTPSSNKYQGNINLRKISDEEEQQKQVEEERIKREQDRLKQVEEERIKYEQQKERQAEEERIKREQEKLKQAERERIRLEQEKQKRVEAEKEIFKKVGAGNSSVKQEVIDTVEIKEAKERAKRKIEALQVEVNEIEKRKYGQAEAAPYKVDGKYIKVSGTYFGALKNGKKDYCGIEIYKNKSFYVGWFKDGERYSYGVLYNADDRKYYMKEFGYGGIQRGSRKTDKLPGRNNKVYIGDISSKKQPNGRIIVLYPNKDIYLGKYRKGKRSSDGCYFDKKQNLINVYSNHNSKGIHQGTQRIN